MDLRKLFNRLIEVDKYSIPRAWAKIPDGNESIPEIFPGIPNSLLNDPLQENIQDNLIRVDFINKKRI